MSELSKDDIQTRLRVVETIEPRLTEAMERYLKPQTKLWQPADFMPDTTADGFMDELKEFRQRAAGVPDALLAVLIGDMITEEALPSYQSWIGRLMGVGDQTGTDQTNWAKWNRAWTAEENRHGDLLNQYLLLSGRVNMKAVQQTVHSLIFNGFDPRTENDPYLGFIYTSFQERATFISHKNTAMLARLSGDDPLQRMCSAIAGDERRHEHAYKFFISCVFDVDPNGAMIAFGKMMRTKITMPAFLMTDVNGDGLFEPFSATAQALKVYTTTDYADIIEDLLTTWSIADRTGLSPDAQKAQDYVCKLPARFHRLAARIKPSTETVTLPWLYDRPINLAVTGN